MANSWLRLWHDMPTNPKIKVVAKKADQPVALVMAMYVALLVDASKNAMSRGVTTCHDEVLAVTLDCDMSQIVTIRDAMQGWFLDGNNIINWEKRQPKREYATSGESSGKSAAERKREQREREKLNKTDDVTQCHDMSQHVTTCHTQDKDKDKDKDKEVNTSCTEPNIPDATQPVDNSKPATKPPGISFDFENSAFNPMPDSKINLWQQAYPAIDVRAEIRKAACWLMANPKNRKSNYDRFLNSWLARAQDSARPAQANGRPNTMNVSQHNKIFEELSAKQDAEWEAKHGPITQNQH